MLKLQSISALPKRPVQFISQPHVTSFSLVKKPVSRSLKIFEESCSLDNLSMTDAANPDHLMQHQKTYTRFSDFILRGDFP